MGSRLRGNDLLLMHGIILQLVSAASYTRKSTSKHNSASTLTFYFIDKATSSGRGPGPIGSA